MNGENAKVSAAEMELTPVNVAEKEPLNPGKIIQQFFQKSKKNLEDFLVVPKYNNNVITRFIYNSSSILKTLSKTSRLYSKIIMFPNFSIIQLTK